MKTFNLWYYVAQFFLERVMFQTKFAEEIKTHGLCSVTPPENRTVYEIFGKKIWQIQSGHR